MFVVIPCKEFNAGKSRLSSCLDTESRRCLCERFLINSLELAAALVSLDRIRVVASDGDAVAIAARRGISAFPDSGRGLNAALDDARTQLEKHEDVVALMVLPVDLPFATPDALAKAAACPADVVVAPDEKGTGTNLLVLGPKAARLPFSFGDNSFILHSAAATAAALSLAVVRDWRIARDIDEPPQFAAWTESQAVNRDLALKLKQAAVKCRGDQSRVRDP